MLHLEAVVAKPFAGLLDGGDLVGGAGVGVELPRLPPDVAVGGAQPWVAALGNLELPHSRRIELRIQGEGGAAS